MGGPVRGTVVVLEGVNGIAATPSGCGCCSAVVGLRFLR
jgi:hypothetical protein